MKEEREGEGREERREGRGSEGGKGREEGRRDSCWSYDL